MVIGRSRLRISFGRGCWSGKRKYVRPSGDMFGIYWKMKGNSVVMVTLGVVKCRLQRRCIEGNIGIMLKSVRW